MKSMRVKLHLLRQKPRSTCQINVENRLIEGSLVIVVEENID